MTRDERLQQIIAILRDGKMHRARDLAERLGVSVRTIWRDMAEISAYGVPVEGERGVGYILRRAVGLPPLVLTREELAALDHLLDLAEAVDDPRLAGGAASLATKIRAALPSAPAEASPEDAGEGLAGDRG
ncbi:HTH domain-containing protein [Thioclava sp. F36-7]|uniref:helix-turn-helix transcriptional regulator n=1 Tax=Thioclava sp. F36-7 TaxID=1915317 RepID=UPI000998E06B|nr:HTH domain-containing protein [Thioclava sp. F36-7]OOY07678.1 DNA-binding protein [Thioclava sp. F36-7]